MLLREQILNVLITKQKLELRDMMEVLAKATVEIILQQMCIKSTHCTPQNYTMLCGSYISIKLGKV